MICYHDYRERKLMVGFNEQEMQEIYEDMNQLQNISPATNEFLKRLLGYGR